MVTRGQYSGAVSDEGVDVVFGLGVVVQTAPMGKWKSVIGAAWQDTGRSAPVKETA